MRVGARTRGRGPSLAALLAALLLGFAAASAEGAERSGGARSTPPPTTAELREATAEHRAAAGSSATISPSSGGVGEIADPPADPGPVLDGRLMVAFYGAPQLGATIIGREGGAREAAKALGRQVRPYRRRAAVPVVPSINLIGTIATADPGRDGRYRFRQPDDLVAGYLNAVRAIGGRLMLDIQPGRSTIRKELRALKPWLSEPDVDVGIDPEWNVGRWGVPGGGRVGSVSHREINDAAQWLGRLVHKQDLPPKALVVHHFKPSMITGRHRIAAVPGVEIAMNFDGIGSPSVKSAIYSELAHPDLFNGFSIFLSRDTSVMRPRQVLGLDPPAAYVMYQ